MPTTYSITRVEQERQLQITALYTAFALEPNLEVIHRFDNIFDIKEESLGVIGIIKGKIDKCLILTASFRPAPRFEGYIPDQRWENVDISDKSDAAIQARGAAFLAWLGGVKSLLGIT